MYSHYYTRVLIVVVVQWRDLCGVDRGNEEIFVEEREAIALRDHLACDLACHLALGESRDMRSRPCNPQHARGVQHGSAYADKREPEGPSPST